MQENHYLKAHLKVDHTLFSTDGLLTGMALLPLREVDPMLKTPRRRREPLRARGVLVHVRLISTV
jgi:hypothetical protein